MNGKWWRVVAVLLLGMCFHFPTRIASFKPDCCMFSLLTKKLARSKSHQNSYKMAKNTFFFLSLSLKSGVLISRWFRRRPRRLWSCGIATLVTQFLRQWQWHHCCGFTHVTWSGLALTTFGWLAHNCVTSAIFPRVIKLFP